MIESERWKLVRWRMCLAWSVPSTRITLGWERIRPLCGVSALWAAGERRLFAAFAPLRSDRKLATTQTRISTKKTTTPIRILRRQFGFPLVVGRAFGPGPLNLRGLRSPSRAGARSGAVRVGTLPFTRPPR